MWDLVTLDDEGRFVDEDVAAAPEEVTCESGWSEPLDLFADRSGGDCE